MFIHEKWQSGTDWDSVREFNGVQETESRGHAKGIQRAFLFGREERKREEREGEKHESVLCVYSRVLVG